MAKSKILNLRFSLKFEVQTLNFKLKHKPEKTKQFGEKRDTQTTFNVIRNGSMVKEKLWIFKIWT